MARTSRHGLSVCAECGRHVRGACSFCGGPRFGMRGGLLVAALLGTTVVACGDDDDDDVPDVISQDVYGAPPRDTLQDGTQAEAIEEVDDIGVQPLYGIPPPDR